ncbi:MAG: hypothetical protein KIT89_00690 [Microcella sp.]|uniref:hypothetical protein n=1 Tax=Microcella sp. TaxID=1913979 RepID=UPI0024C9A190|nr:hypothetical protein [Microcella sp.]UYN83795.1 MAG: hypothetical protein KIT89_00690 [Microcella sp.]
MSKHRHVRRGSSYRRHVWSSTRTVFVSIISSLVVLASMGFSTPTRDELFAAYIDENAQSLEVQISAVDALPIAERHDFSATPGYETFIAGGTNHDWAKLVLLMGEFPLTDSNVIVVTRWMRQENYVDRWWTRNNPLNNGWGSGGGGGTGRYATLVDAAENAAEALHALPRYREIVRTLNESAPTSEVERAIWFSGWATGMYNNGAHWSYADVPVVTAPPSAWGR